VNTPR